jgi:hypothetical protein
VRKYESKVPSTVGKLLTGLIPPHVCACPIPGPGFQPVTTVSSTNKTDRNDITEILLKGASSTIKMYMIITTTAHECMEMWCLFKEWFVMLQSKIVINYYIITTKIQIILYLRTDIVSLNLAHGEVYSIQHYVIKFVSDLRQFSCFHQVLRIPPPIKLTATI